MNKFPHGRHANTQRWITIGRIQRKYIRLGNCGFPNGFVMHWVGRTAWCQEFEFLKFTTLMAHVRMRLGFAGLYPVSFASSVPAGIYIGECELRVLVKRNIQLMRTRKARRQRVLVDYFTPPSLAPSFIE